MQIKREKRTASWILAFCMCFILLAPSNVMAEEENVEEEERGGYVICAEENADLPIGQSDSNEIIASGMDEVLCETDLSKQQMDQLEHMDGVLVEENFFLSGSAEESEPVDGMNEENEGEGQDDWNYQMIRLGDVSESEGEAAASVKVAVLDSGVELLSDISVAGDVNLVKEEQYLPYYMNDMTGHGTAVADIIHNICPDAEIYSVRVLDKENKGRLSDIVEGIYWCIEHDMDIINMSFGTPKDSEILNRAVQAAKEHGILLVASAGNGGIDSGVEYPAAWDEVMAVGAVNTSAERTDESAAGPEVELMAPGEQIKTESMLGLTTVNSGTSMAAPHITGAAALLMLQDQEKNAEKIRKILDKSGNPLGSAEEYGNGLLDLAYAQELMEEDAPQEEAGEENQDAGNDNQEGMGQEDMPGPEERPVPAFEDIDYAEGRWYGTDHAFLMEEAANNYANRGTAFTATQIKLIKAGAVYPDQAMRSRVVFPEWHGHYSKNYVANFIFATKIAQAGGATANLTKVVGQDSDCYNRMKSNITSSKIKYVTVEKVNDSMQITGEEWRTWDTVIAKQTGLDYAGKSASTQKNWRKYFLYGMSSHVITDTFAHSVFKKNADGTYSLIEHPAADSPINETTQKYKNRYQCARLCAYRVAIKCQEDKVGKIVDFSAVDTTYKGYWSGFYLRHVLKYVQKTDDYQQRNASDLVKLYEKVNY